MNYIEAVKAAKGGAKIRRKGWPSMEYWDYDDGSIKRWCRLYEPDTGDIDHILATDWEIVEEGHDWAWALERLREGENVRRRGSSMYAANQRGRVVWRDTETHRNYPHASILLNDFDATDWVLYRED